MWRRLNLNKKGFTIMELIVVLGVFSISSIIIVEIFMFTNKSQKKIIESQKLQDDINYTLEVMARAVRLGRVNYEHYGTVANPTSALFLFDSDGRAIIFYKESDPARCVNSNSAPCMIQGLDTDADGIADEITPITAKGTKINDVKFYILPAVDPFLRKKCDVNADCTLTNNCQNNLCAVPNEQPVITMIIDAVKTETVDPQPANLIIQTTVSSREFYR